MQFPANTPSAPLSWVDDLVPARHLAELCGLIRRNRYHNHSQAERLWNSYLWFGGDPGNDAFRLAAAYHNSCLLPNQIAGTSLSIDLWMSHSEAVGRTGAIIDQVSAYLASTARDEHSVRNAPPELADLYLYDLIGEFPNWERHEDDLRQEFWMVSEADFMAETVHFLRRTLDGRQAIYRMPQLTNHFESQTRCAIRRVTKWFERRLGTSLHLVAFN